MKFLPAEPPQNPGRIGARALSMVWECRRVAIPLSFSVKVGSSSAQPSGRTPLMRVLNSSPSSLYLLEYSSRVCTQHKTEQGAKLGLSTAALGLFAFHDSTRSTDAYLQQCQMLALGKYP